MASVFYPTNILFPSEYARTIQIVNTGAYLSCFHKVFLMFAGKKSDDISALQRYGISHQTFPSLNIVHLPALLFPRDSFIRISYRGIFDFFCKLYILFNKDKNSILYTREIKTAYNLLPLKKVKNLPFIYEAHHIEYMITKNNKRKIRKLEEKVYSLADAIVVVNPLIKELLIKEFKIPSHKIFIIPNGCRENEYRDPLNSDSEYLLYIGDFFSWKGVDTIVKMMKFLPNEKLVMCGGTQNEDKKRIENLIKKENLQERIVILERRPYNELPMLMEKAKLFLLPNTSELYNQLFTCPIKLYEYLAGSRPVIASKVRAIQTLVGEGNGVIFAEPDNPQDFAYKVNTLLSNKELYLNLCKKAYEYSLRFTWSQRALRISGVIDWVLNNRG